MKGIRVSGLVSGFKGLAAEHLAACGCQDNSGCEAIAEPEALDPNTPLLSSPIADLGVFLAFAAEMHSSCIQLRHK